MRYNVRHIVTRGSRLVADHTVETTAEEARVYTEGWLDRTAVDLEMRGRDGVLAYRWTYVGSREVHTVVFWPLADDAKVGDGYPTGIVSTFHMSAMTGEGKTGPKMMHPSGATGSTVDEADEPEPDTDEGALDRLLYAVGRACEPRGSFGEVKSDQRRAVERITAEALVQFAYETGAVTEVNGEKMGPATLLVRLIDVCGGYR